MSLKSLLHSMVSAFLLTVFFSASLYADIFNKITIGEIVTGSNFNNIPAWGDYDNDGDQDVVISTLNDSCGSCLSPILFFKNNGNGTFTRVTNNTIAQQMIYGSGLAWGDYDNDNFLDLFVCGTINSRNKLFHNEGNGNFSLVTSGIVVNDLLAWSQGCAWVDYNKDRKLDLFVTNRYQSNFLYKNNGGGNFTKITTGSIVNDIGSSRSCAWGDYDNDGWQDVFVVNYDGLSDFLYHNNGDETFTRILDVPMANDHEWGSCCAWFDYDNNNYLDLFITNTGSNGYNRLYTNHGGHFTLSNSLPSHDRNSYGFSWGDYDNDGLTDLFICNKGSINTLYNNHGASSFIKILDEIVSQEGIWSVTGSFIDYNKDGHLDLLVANRFVNFHNYLYKNTSQIGKYIEIRVRACEGAASAIGTRIKVVTGDLKQIKEVSSGSGWGSQSSHWSHFGLGDASIIDSVIVYWQSDSVTKLVHLPVNHSVTINECSGEVIGINNEISKDLNYKLYQNYPNPFNPNTIINYQLLTASYVSLKIYDVTGKEIETLVNEMQDAGNYTVNFNARLQGQAANLSSGIYYYRIVADEFTETKKMILSK